MHIFNKIFMLQKSSSIISFDAFGNKFLFLNIKVTKSVALPEITFLHFPPQKIRFFFCKKLIPGKNVQLHHFTFSHELYMRAKWT